MAYSEKELENLKRWLNILEDELEELHHTAAATMIGIEVGQEFKQMATLPIPEKYAPALKRLLAKLYKKDILMLKNLITNMPKASLAEELAAKFIDVTELINQWNYYKLPDHLTLSASLKNKSLSSLPVPSDLIEHFISIIVKNLLSERRAIEKRILLLAHDEKWDLPV